MPSLRAWAEKHGAYHLAKETKAESGDVFTMPRYDKQGKLVGGHAGFVSEVAADGSLVTAVEGNLGDGVKTLKRRLSSLDGFIKL